MGYEDREYRAPLDYATRITPAVKGILIATISVYVLQVILGGIWPGRLEGFLAFSPAKAVERLWLWQFVTAGFLHDPSDLWHILLNMLILGMVGPEIERLYSTRRFLVLYAGSIAFAHLCYAFVHAAHPFREVMGASGAITGLLVLFAIHFPDARIWLFFFFPVRARVAVLILLAMDLHATLIRQSDGIAHAAHLGGALFAFGYSRTYVWFEERLRFVDRLLARRDRRRERAREADDRAMDEGVNAVLEKVSREGIQSLTAEERALLDRASRKYRDR